MRRPAEAMPAMLGREDLEVALDQPGEIDQLGLQLERAPGLDPRQIQQLRDDAPRVHASVWI